MDGGLAARALCRSSLVGCFGFGEEGGVEVAQGHDGFLCHAFGGGEGVEDGSP